MPIKGNKHKPKGSSKYVPIKRKPKKKKKKGY